MRTGKSAGTLSTVRRVSRPVAASKNETTVAAVLEPVDVATRTRLVVVTRLRQCLSLLAPPLPWGEPGETPPPKARWTAGRSREPVSHGRGVRETWAGHTWGVRKPPERGATKWRTPVEIH